MDHKLLKDIFDQYYSRLVFFSMKYIDSRDDAEDIVQEAFSKFWFRRGDISTQDHLAVKSYLFQTVKNEALNCLKHKGVIAAHQGAQHLDETDLASPLTDIIHTELIAEIHKAIADLPIGCRQVAIELFIRGKKYAEVADELAISINTVKSQRKRALGILRPKLSDVAFVLLINGYVYVNMG